MTRVPGPQDPRPPGCWCGDNFDPKCPAGHSREQRPSKDQLRLWRQRVETYGGMQLTKPESLALFAEIERLSKPAHERESPHCSTCSCGMQPEPPAIAHSVRYDVNGWNDQRNTFCVHPHSAAQLNAETTGESERS